MRQKLQTGRQLTQEREAVANSQPRNLLVNVPALVPEPPSPRYATDIVAWVRDCVWTYDPRVTPTVMPFNVFPRQAEFLHWLAEREQSQEDGLAEKSRDSGLTWLCCAYMVHGWLFRPGFKGSFGSRKLDLVDKLGDLDSIFEKLRFILRHLPEGMLPEGFVTSKHAPLGKIINPVNGATLTGEGGDEIGRGGRASIYIVDEHAFVRRAKRVEAALSQNSRCIIRVSTPNGAGNEFYRKRFSGSVPVFTYHWRDDPRKDEAWYEREKARISDPVIVAQEIDIDYSASVEGLVIPAAWVRAAVGLEDALNMERRGLIYAGLDIAEAGRCRTVLGFRQGPVVTEILDWGQLNTTQTAYRARDEVRQRGAVLLNYDSVGVGAGVSGTLKTLAADAQDPDAPRSAVPFLACALNGGSAPSDTIWPDGKTAKEKFTNARAEWWWLLRLRFEKAYECRELGIAHPPEEMISLPNHPHLIAELSLPLCAYTETGKIRIESKPQMAQRGLASPDFADMLTYLFAVPPIETAWNVL